MEIEEGMMYSIVTMPATVSIDAVDDIMKDFNEAFLADHPEALVLLKMKGISQLNKAGLMLIEKMHESVEKAKGEFVIAEVNDGIETILKHLGVHARVPVFKTILDFEKNRGLVMSVDIQESSPAPGAAASPAASNWRLPTRVMIIEPSLTSRNNIRNHLKKLSIANISEAKDCNEAMRMIRTGSDKTDAIIINIAEARMQGVSFITNRLALPNSAQSRCFLFMACGAGDEIVREAMDAGAQGQIPGIGTEKELREFLLGLN
jgi:anti-anti-sigma regulatory factor